MFLYILYDTNSNHVEDSLTSNTQYVNMIELYWKKWCEGLECMEGVDSEQYIKDNISVTGNILTDQDLKLIEIEL